MEGSCPFQGGGAWPVRAVLTRGLCPDRYCDQWLSLTLPEEERGNGLRAAGVQSARYPATGGGAAEATEGCGQQDALCAHKLLYPQVRMAWGQVFCWRAFYKGFVRKLRQNTLGGGELGYR